jgi:inositol transport system substrate-binding protein
MVTAGLHLSCKGKSFRYTFGVSYQNVQNEFIINIQDALRAKAEELNIRIIEADGQGRAEQQISQVENFIVQRVDAIILNPFDRYSCVPIVDQAAAAGVPIVVVNAQVDNLQKASAYVGSDDREAGRIEMQYIADLLHGKGQVAIIHGPNGHSAEINRTLGNYDILAKYPDMNVVAEQTANWDRAQAMTLMENWLQGGKKIDAVVAQNDEMALGACKAIEAAGKQKEILCIGIDAIADAVQAVKEGKLAATVFQDAKGQGAGAVQVALAIVQGNAVPHMNYIPFQLITKEHLQSGAGK